MRRALTLAAGLLSATLAEPGDVTGRLVSNGKPLAGVTVSAVPFESTLAAARREARQQPAPTALATAVSAADGTFALTVPPTAGLVRIAASGRIVPFLSADPFDGGAGAEVGDLRVDAKPVVLAGRVVGAGGAPVPGARVSLFVSSSAWPAVTTTGADGSFRFEQAAERRNRLTIEKPGSAPADLRSVAGGALHTPIALVPARTVSGLVRRADGRTAAAGALVRAEGADTMTRWTQAGADGRFTIEAPPGELRLAARDGEQGSVSATVGEGPVTLTLQPASVLAGRVLDARTGAPVAGARVVARGPDLAATSEASGRFLIRGLDAPLASVEAGAPRYADWARDDLKLTPGGTRAVDVPLRAAVSLTGRVVDEVGAPVAGARLTIVSGDPMDFRNMRRMFGGGARWRSGPDGRFTIGGLAPGSNRTLTVRHDDYEPGSVGGLVLSASAPARPVSVVLRRGPGLAGVVKDEDGRPVAGVEIALSMARSFQGGRGANVNMMMVGGPDAFPRRETGPDGRFELRGLAAGSYQLAASKRGYATARLDNVKVAEPGEDVELTLRAGASIEGVIRDRTGRGAEGFVVGASQPGGPRGPGLARAEPTSADGRFVIDGLVPGESYDLQAFGESGMGPRKAGVTAPATDVELLVPGFGRVRGRVTDAETGQPITAFTARHRQPDQGGMFVMRFGYAGGGDEQPMENPDGRYTLEDVPVGRWDVEVTAQGYQRARIGDVQVEAGTTVEGVDVVLSRGGRVMGRVTDATSGQPVLDASVEADLAGEGPGPLFDDETGSGSARTDADGRYLLPGLAPGPYVLTVKHPDYSEGSARVAVEADAASVDVKLSAGSHLAGVVVDGRARPVPGAFVMATPAGDNSFGDPFRGKPQGLTDVSGRFRFDRLAPGRYTLTASLRGENSEPLEVALLAGASRDDLALTLASGATLRGRVTGLADDRRANVNVTALTGGDFFGSTRTDAAGAFELTGLPRGTVDLRAMAGDFASGTRSASAQVTIAEGQAEATVEIAFAAGFRVEGRVLRGSEAVAGAHVVAMSEQPGRMASARADESGTFVLEGLVEGAYDLRASAPEGAGSAHRRVQVSGDVSDVDLEMPVGRIAGVVVEAGSGRPISDATVQVEEQVAGRFGLNVVSTDATGRFTLEGLEPRPWTVVVRKAAYEAETREIDAGSGHEVTIELRRGQGLALQVRDGIFDTPLRGVVARVADAAGTLVFMGDIPLDGEGRGEIPSLKAGTYEVRIGGSGYATLSLPSVVSPSTPLAVRLTPGGTLEIRSGPQTLARTDTFGVLLTSAGTPYATSLFAPDPSIRLSQPVRRIGNVVPGSYRLVVGAGPQEAVEIREGQTTVVELP